MRRLLCLGLSCTAWASAVWAQEVAPVDQATTQADRASTQGTTPWPEGQDRELRWSLGAHMNMNDLRHPTLGGLRPMVGLRWGRWRTGAVDGENWHRFGQIKTDNTLTYDLLGGGPWRTSLSAGIVNLQRDARFDALQSGRKTVRGRFTVDYLGWPFWSVGLVVRQDLLGRGAGTSLSPSVTYRKPVSEDSTILLTHTVNLARSDQWRYTQQDSPTLDLSQPSRWGTSMDTSLTLRQRWKPHWSWYAQFNRNQTLKAGDPMVPSGQVNWSGQVGVIYFER